MLSSFLNTASRQIDPDPQSHAMAQWLQAAADGMTSFNTVLPSFVSEFWTFVSPLLSLAVLLLIVDWFLRQFGIRISATTDIENLASKR
jgi:hypothetical protein